MYPPRFRYERPASLDDVIGLLSSGRGEAKVLAGGQSLVPLMKLRFAAPELLVDINDLPGLDHHRVEADGSLHIGALCRHAMLERSTILPGSQPTMAAAAPLIADPIVRTRGTLVGSLCHADPQGDWAAVVMALGGSVVAQGPAGRRSIASRDFVTGPFENTLAYDEVAVEAVIPAPTGTPGRQLPQARAAGRRLRHRRRGRRDRAHPGHHRPGRDRADGRRAAPPSTPATPPTRSPDSGSMPRPSPERPSSRPRPPGRGPTIAAALRTRSTSCTPSSRGS